MVMAGGQGSRLKPLTEKRSKPAVPFGSRYRIVDFVLSNLVNSGIFSIYLLVQYKSQSLIEHIRNAWTLSPLFSNQFVTVVPPQMREGETWFRGTADAICQNLNLIESQHPDLVLVFGADHIYRMDVNQMIDFHLERDADVTVAALPVPVEQSPNFGIIAADADGRIRDFQEKPRQPAPMPGDATRAYASMGNYLFTASCLVRALRAAHKHGETDFGASVLPRMLGSKRLFAYDFSRNRVAGIKSYEEHAYWRDVGTIDAYYEAHRDVLGAEPRLAAAEHLRPRPQLHMNLQPNDQNTEGIGLQQSARTRGTFSFIDTRLCLNDVCRVRTHWGDSLSAGIEPQATYDQQKKN